MQAHSIFQAVPANAKHNIMVTITSKLKFSLSLVTRKELATASNQRVAAESKPYSFFQNNKSFAILFYMEVLGNQFPTLNHLTFHFFSSYFRRTNKLLG
jgi:hypothetical protein